MATRRTLLVSVALHGAVFLGLWAIPETPPPTRYQPRHTAIELITMPRVPTPEVVEAAATESTAPEGGEASETRVATRRRPRNTRRRASGPRSEVSVEPGPTPAPTEASTAEQASGGPEAPGVSLALRGHSRSDAGRTSPRLSPSFRTPTPRPSPRDDGVIRTPQDAGFRRAKGGRWIYRNPNPKAAWTAELLPDGRVHFSDPPLTPCRRGPCWLNQKKDLLAKTWDMRLKRATSFARANISRQLAALQQDLLAIWRSHRPPHRRRILIFERWDECEETIAVDLGDFSDGARSQIDELRANAGTRARAQIIEFIVTLIPEHSDERYTEAELLAMNKRRQSTERFDPYRSR